MNKRWISREIGHLDDHMGMLKVDIYSGNKASALTNLALAMGIVRGMADRDKESTRGIEKIGKTIGVLRKHLKPLMKEVAKEAIKAYIKKETGR